MEGMTLPSDARLGPNCGVTAVAVAAGVPFAQAWQVLARLGGRSGRWKGVTNHDQRKAALAIFGVPFTELALPRRMRLETWARRARPGVRYMVRTTGHVQMLWRCPETGTCIVLDQNGPRPLVLFGARRKMVTAVLSFA